MSIFYFLFFVLINLPDPNVVLSKIAEALYDLQHLSKQELMSTFSYLPAEVIIDIVSHTWLDLNNVWEKHIMSIGEWVPILANMLSDLWANVIAVDPVYTQWTDSLYNKTKVSLDITSKILSEELFITLLGDTEILKQYQRMNELVLLWATWFNEKLFTSKILFNNSHGDSILGVDNYSQDIVMLLFILNNVKSGDMFDILCWSIEKLKKWGSLVIVSAEDLIKENSSFFSDYKFLASKYAHNKTIQVVDGQSYVWLCFTKS